MAYLEEWEEDHAKRKKTQIRAYIEVKRLIYHFTMIHWYVKLRLCNLRSYISNMSHLHMHINVLKHKSEVFIFSQGD